VIPAISLEEDDNDDRRLAHNLAQFVHCVAQGKVGSGFDISAAVFGSHIYTRFDPAVIQNVMDDTSVCPLEMPSVLKLSVKLNSHPYSLSYLLRIPLGTMLLGILNSHHTPE
jgi:phosphomevalonate kinase